MILTQLIKGFYKHFRVHYKNKQPHIKIFRTSKPLLLNSNRQQYYFTLLFLLIYPHIHHSLQGTIPTTMSHSPTLSDQRTIKRCNSNLQNFTQNSNNLFSRPSITYQIKKPLDQLFYKHHINSSDSSTNLEISHHFIAFQTPKEPNQFANLNDSTKNLEQKQSQKDQRLSNCCARLFTFMESTQKDKFIEQNKENQFQGNLLNLQSNRGNSFKPNNNDLPLKFNPKAQGSTKYLKKIDYRAKNRQKLPNDQEKPTQNKQNELLNFIQGSRKKRQQLLIQLQQLDFDHLESLCQDNIKYLTPQERIAKKSTPKIKIESSRNSLNGSKMNKNFFRKQSISNLKKSPRVIMKENIRQRHFSSNSNNNFKSTLSPKNVQISQRNKIRSELHVKVQDKLLKQKENQSKKNLFQRKHSEIKLIKDNLSGKISSRKLRQTSQIHDRGQESLKKSISKRDSHRKSATKQIPVQKNVKTMEQLTKRKKQLEKQLMNLNDDIVLFNKKKKKTLKGLK